MGYPVLPLDSTRSGFQHVLPAFYAHDKDVVQEIAQSLARKQQAVLPPAFDRAQDAAAAYAARSAFLRKMVAVLGRLIAVSAPLLPRAATVLEYEAWVRHMVRADDVIEASWAAEASAAAVVRLPGRSGRTTRNSQQRYERWISLPPELRQVLAATALQWWRDA
jgi:hypothetical protein